MKTLFGIVTAWIMALATPALADPALWVAHGPNATVYLFGTIHMLPKQEGTAWLDKAIRAALSSSSELWTEADIGNLSSSVAAIQHYGLAPEGSTAALLPAGYRARFDREIGESGIPAALASHARPWLAEILLDGAALQHAGPVSLGVESVLLGFARDHHMRTPTFETLDQQFAMLADMPVAAQVASLEQQIDEFDHSGPLFAQLLAVWRAGDVATLDRLSNQDMRSHDEAVWTELILRRNERFAQRIGERLQGTGTAFVAVGAAHLVGATGVPALLSRAGMSVRRLQ